MNYCRRMRKVLFTLYITYGPKIANRLPMSIGTQEESIQWSIGEVMIGISKKIK